MAAALPSTLNVRLLIAVGDGDPVEVGTLEAPGVTLLPLRRGESIAQLEFSPRRWRRALRRFFRAAARAV